MNRRLLRSFSRAVFFFGAIVGFALAVILIWSRMEAIHYFFMGATHEPYRGLRCPIMMSPTEEGVITVVFSNPTSQEVNFFYRIATSGREIVDQGLSQIAVSPRQTKSLQFSVDANHVDLGFFVFVKMTISPNALHPTQEAVCGIVVADLLGLAGSQISIAALSLSFLGMALGLGVGQWAGNNEDQNGARVMQVLGGAVLLTLLAGSMGWWMFGMALSAITVLLMLISVRLVIA